MVTMTDKEDGVRRSSPPAFYPIWHPNPNIKFEITRVACAVLGLLVTLYLICMVSALADSFYVPGQQPSLPDRIHDQLLHRRPMPHWLHFIVDGCTMTVLFLVGFRNFCLLPFPLNLQVTSRFFTMLALGFWIRAVAIVVTTVPPSKAQCIPRVTTTALDFLVAAFYQAADHNKECAGMIISAHSLNIMHSFMCLVFYGRCRSAPEKKDVATGCCCRDVTCKGEPYDTLHGCFLYQFFAFVKLWMELRKRGCPNAAATAAGRCFPPTPLEPTPSVGPRRRGPLRMLWSAITRLPLLRYLCYFAAFVAWICIPLCYNHYTVDVYLALLLGVLIWVLYHLILTILLVQKKVERDAAAGFKALVEAPGSLGPQCTDWRFGQTGHCSEAAPNFELVELGEVTANASNNYCLQLESKTQKEANGGDGESETGRVQEVVTQVTSPDKENSTSSVPTPEAAFAADFQALHLAWILDFPVLKPLSWCIRKLEGI